MVTLHALKFWWDNVRYVPELPALVAKARRQSGKPGLVQLGEMLRLLSYPNKVRFEEYYKCSLFSRTWVEARDFMGRYMNRSMEAVLNDHVWVGIARDKLLFGAAMAGFGLRTPEVQAVYHAGHREMAGVRFLRNAADIEAFLRTELTCPAFCKPIYSNQGFGAVGIESIDTAGDMLQFTDGSHHPIGSFISEHILPYPEGYMIQEHVRSSPLMTEFAGDQAFGLRIVMLNGPSGPRMHTALWKLKTGRNMVDHWLAGRHGNLLAPINVADGTVEAIITGAGFEYGTRRDHPESGVVLVGHRLPGWDEICEACYGAATALQGMGIQAYDIALTDRGVVFLECNSPSSMVSVQATSYRGAHDETMRSFLSEFQLDLSRYADRRRVERERRTWYKVDRADKRHRDRMSRAHR